MGIDVTVDNQRLAPLPIEPLAIVAEPDGAGGLTVWCGHQAPHRLKAQLSRLLGIDRVRVIVPDVGGAFGMKGMPYPEYVVVAACALRTGRPVGWTETRTEHFLGGTHGRSMRHRVRLGGERSGRLRAAEIDIIADVGAYPHNGTLVPTLSAWVAQGPYDLDQLRVRATSVVTNAAPTGSYRGAGRPEAAYALERAVDAFAHAADVTPDGIALGVGVAVFVERAGGAPESTEYARVELTPHGPEARMGTADSGQGHATVWSSIVADVLGGDPDEVTVVTCDTAGVAEGTGTFASRSAQLAGPALHRTAGVVRERIAQVAGANARGGHARPRRHRRRRARGRGPDRRRDAGGGRRRRPGHRTGDAPADRRGRRLRARAAPADRRGADARGRWRRASARPCTSRCGMVRTASHRCRASSTTTHRRRRTCRTSRPTVSSAPRRPTRFGVKGSGEAGCIGAPPAIVNATLDALRPHGVTHLDMPLHPERVWRALQAARG